MVTTRATTTAGETSEMRLEGQGGMIRQRNSRKYLLHWLLSIQKRCKFANFGNSPRRNFRSC